MESEFAAMVSKEMPIEGLDRVKKESSRLNELAGRGYVIWHGEHPLYGEILTRVADGAATGTLARELGN